MNAKQSEGIYVGKIKDYRIPTDSQWSIACTNKAAESFAAILYYLKSKQKY